MSDDIAPEAEAGRPMEEQVKTVFTDDDLKRNRNQFLIALEEYWRKRDSADNDWMDVEVNSIDLFDACQKLGFFK